ncbi:alpha-L-fucosidase [Arachidicoccus sp.]|uniref:alpha-L-fucosidase n=1 Tax=Arachidicoccus sp. TaxID=1872624 RepID=UPI003D24E89C
MERRKALQYLGSLAPGIVLSKHLKAVNLLGKSNVESVKFQPTWDSLSQYKVPDWFRDAKFGMWAHWGPQCLEAIWRRPGFRKCSSLKRTRI